MGNNYDHWYVEQTDDGRFAAKRGRAQRASAIEDTQQAAIDRARAIDSNSPIHVERVRHSNRGNPDKWRKP